MSGMLPVCHFVLQWFPYRALDSHPFFPSQHSSDRYCLRSHGAGTGLVRVASLVCAWGPVLSLLQLWCCRGAPKKLPTPHTALATWRAA